MTVFLVGLAVGLAAAWLGGLLRGRAPAPPPRAARDPGVGPHLLPEPALGWLLRAHDALGVWVSELSADEEGPRAERVVDGDRLGVAQIQAVDRRLERARDREEGGAERLDAGTLVFRAAGGFAVGLLLRAGHDVASLHQAEHDLERLLEGVRRRPQVVALAQAQTQAASLESVGSVGLRLAYHLERCLDAEVLVAAAEAGGVRVVGVSGRGDRRLLEAVLPPDAELARVARGDRPQMLTGGDALGGVVADRRHREGAMLLVPIAVGSEPPVGAVAIHLPRGEEPFGPARAELVEAVTKAGPPLSRALEAERAKREATTDLLTSLPNRRTLQDRMRQHDVESGALIYADLDNFKQLNDTLGHAAGDSALQHLARIIREQVRGGDTPARIGGEEFAIWLPRASLELGMRIAERIRIKLGTTPWDWQGRHWPLTASFGVSACPETNDQVANLPAQADAALYVAKRSGRNRVEAAGTGAGR
ncbi:MAG TPA: GGDEF domain-containing protein [Gemmatimonadales bacterium]|nr:GGDEF domain-containing protein [Gemmatimonadales bacterium]